MRIPRRLNSPRVRALALIGAAVIGALWVVLAASLSLGAGVRVVAAAPQTAPSHAPAQLIGLSPALARTEASRKPAAPVIKTQPANAYAAPGSHAHFVAAASGDPRPRAQWQVSDNGGASWRSIRGVHSYTYSFMAAARQNGEEFRAVFKNKRGTRTTVAAKLSVVAGYAAPAIDSQPTSMTVAAGATASFSAVAKGDPAPTVQWQLSANGGATWSNAPQGTAQTLTFLASSILSGYEFRARFTNVLGTTLSSTATLTVTGSDAGETPVVTQQPAGQDALQAGATATFTAAASGSPAPSVQWQVSTDHGQTWRAIPGETSTTYSFTATTSDDLNEYNAVFTNSAGMATTEPAVLGVGYQLSSNWAGYAAVGGNTYTSVTATWIVPHISCTAGSDQYSSQWVGIDGASNDPTVEQDGTYANCEGATSSYGAWYELYGDHNSDAEGGREIDFASPTVNAGDSVTATVTVDNSGNWTFTVHDNTDGWTGSMTVLWSAPTQSSAEWIVERPELCDENGGNCDFATLANFGAVPLTNATAADGSGDDQSPGQLGAFPLQMIRSATDSTLLASPSGLSGPNNTSFFDTWQAGF